VAVARFSTGLAGLDAQLGGGVPAGSCHLVLGEPMNAQELLSYHFAAAGTAAGGTVFYTTDYTPDEVTAGLRRVGGKPERMAIVELPKEGDWKVAGPGKGVRIVVDSYSDLVLEWGWDEAFHQLRRLKEQMRKAGGNLFISCATGLHDEAQRTRLRQWADGVLELGFDRQGFGLYPYLKVTKLRGVPESSRFLLFKETEQGLFMESTKRVF
jgi:KaiC/GvpD/RAD55 family RecA-like ATPase